jgi:hypothetical protein
MKDKVQVLRDFYYLFRRRQLTLCFFVCSEYAAPQSPAFCGRTGLTRPERHAHPASQTPAHEREHDSR